jgi:hypothetical protein
MNQQRQWITAAAAAALLAGIAAPVSAGTGHEFYACVTGWRGQVYVQEAGKGWRIARINEDGRHEDLQAGDRLRTGPHSWAHLLFWSSGSRRCVDARSQIFLSPGKWALSLRGARVERGRMSRVNTRWERLARAGEFHEYFACVTALRGPAYVWHKKDGWRPVQGHFDLFPGHSLATGSGAWVDLRFAFGGRRRIRPNSRVYWPQGLGARPETVIVKRGRMVPR